jgi:hypothetical protein
MTPAPDAPRLPRFLSLFAVALAVRLITVVVGLLFVPVQPAKPVRVFGVGIAGFPPDLRPDDPSPERIRNEILAGSARAIEPWYRWDAGWMANLAENGYAGAEDASGRIGVAFLPAMPATMAGARAFGLNPFWVGLLVANLAGAAGAAVFARVAVRLAGNREVGLRAFVLLIAFPSAFFFSAPYNESFGLLFTALAMAAWLDLRPVRAGVFAALGSLARMTGVAVGVAALAAWLFEDRTRRGLWRAVAVAAGSFAGLLLFWGYLWLAVGDPLAGLKAQPAWGRRPLSVWNPLYAVHSIYDPAKPHWGEAVVVLGFAVLGVRAWLRRGAFWGVLTLVPVAQMVMSGTFLSGHRLILAALPGFIELADVLRTRFYFRLTVVGFVLVQLVLLNRFVHWYWAG